MSDRKRVIIPSLHSRFNPLRGDRAPTIDLNPAAALGDLCLLCDWHQGADVQEAAETIKDQIASIGVRETDLILSTGSPLLLGVVFTIYADHFQTVNVLEWERATHSYVIQSINS
jgi:hypothetical protein